MILLAVGLYVVITFAIQTVHVLGLSMYPTLNNNDYLVATKIDYRFHGPQRGDIIVMRDPFDSSRDFIKRVIAVPGDRLEIRDSHIYINGQLLVEPYLRTDEPWTVNNTWPPPGMPNAGGPYVLAANQYFVMGDNRNASSDSRVFGPISRDRIDARAWFRIWPLSSFGPVDHYTGYLESVSTGATAA
ncbi:MAG TPA: signal peptidase I [Candidatus Dormibacteraeota bacterium]